MKIDVLLPVATESQYIEDAILSVAQQKANIAIHLIENNIGNPEYSSKLKKIAERYSANYVFFEERLPIFENWQRCLSIGNAEWVAFLHDDDVWSTNYLVNCIEYLNMYDIIFYQYEYFKDKLPPKRDLKKITTKELETRENLLAKSVGLCEHMSSSLFRRNLRLFFPPSFKFLGDQYAIRNSIAVHKDIHVIWILPDYPNYIRCHPQQETNRFMLLHSAKESSLCYRIFFASICNENILKTKFVCSLKQNYSEKALSRIFSAILFRRPFWFTLKLYIITLLKYGTISFIFDTFVRLLLQNIIWYLKLTSAKLHK
jgi:hypothetical protein